MGHTCLPDREHVDLGNERWADLRTRLTHAEAQEIESAQIAANFDTKGSFEGVTELVRSLVLATPDEWRKEHADNVVGMISRALENYELSVETSLKQPATRKLMADATMDLLDTYGRVFLAEASFGAWPPEDGQEARILSRRAQLIWIRWNTELRARLKAAGTATDAD